MSQMEKNVMILPTI
uniref:Uncharacterized protein n=1 Tax=Anguilla anguilla TaxID=7936 RepID=A0A0E9RW14_ANGAN